MTKDDADEIVMKNAVCCELFTHIRRYSPKQIAYFNFTPQPTEFKLMLDAKDRYVIGLKACAERHFTKLGFYDSNGKSHYYVLEDFVKWKSLLNKEIALYHGSMWRNAEPSLVLQFRAHLLDIMIENSAYDACWRKTRLPMPFDVNELYVAWGLGTFKIHEPSKEAMIQRLMLSK